MGESGWVTAGEGEAVVMLHSSMSSSMQWGDLMERLKTTHRVIAVDLYGYASAPPVTPEMARDFTMDMEVKRIQAILSELLGDGAATHLVGHSYGGAVALHFALAAPDQVRSLTLYEPMANHAIREIDDDLYCRQRGLMDQVVDAVTEGRLHDAAGMFVDFFNGKGLFGHLPASVQQLLAESAAKVPLDYAASAHPSLSISRYRDITAPTCLLAGAESPDLSSEISRVLSELIPNVSYGLIKAGHMAPLTHSQLVNPLMVEHIQAHTLRLAG